MQKALTAVMDMRKQLNLRGMHAAEDSDIARCITANPIEIKRIRKDLHIANVGWERHIAKQLRILKRNQSKKRALEEAELEEEEWEHIVKEQ
jgi:hypothetical protein